MADNKKIINISDDSSGEDLHAIEVKIDKLMDIKAKPDSSDTNESIGQSATPKIQLIQSTAKPETKIEAPPPAADEEPADIPSQTDDVTQPAEDWKAAGLNSDDSSAPEVSDDASTNDHELADKAPTELDDEPDEPAPKKRSLKAKVGHFFAAWWHNRRARRATLATLVVLLLALAILPPSRAFGLNLVGVRSTAKITVLDATTQLPLANVDVSIGNVTAKSDAKGHASLQKVKLGNQRLVVQRVAFATVTKPVNINMGSTSLGQVLLKAVGTQYKFKVTDYVSGKPVVTARAVSGDAIAVADKQGNIVLTANDPGTNSLPVSVTADGYRTAQLNVPLGTSDVTSVGLVNSLKAVYISKQSGKYDVYQSDIDGQNKKLLLPATGSETSDNTLVENGNGQLVALVNNRDNTKDSSGYLLQTLTLIDIDTGAPTTIDHSERIQIVGWFETRIVYVAIKAGASAANPSRYLLMSYDAKTNQRLQLDHANAFNDVVSANGAIYYATSNGYNGGVSQFNKINADNTGKQTLLVSEVWNVFRLDYSDFRLATGDTNYSYTLGDSKPTSTKDAYNNQNRLYVDSPDGKHSLWVDNRDGKGTLISYDTTTHKDTVLAQVAGLDNPVHWLGNDLAVYRVHSATESADYVVSISGGTPKKITDLTDAKGLSLWYYY